MENFDQQMKAAGECIHPHRRAVKEICKVSSRRREQSPEQAGLILGSCSLSEIMQDKWNKSGNMRLNMGFSRVYPNAVVFSIRLNSLDHNISLLTDYPDIKS